MCDNADVNHKVTQTFKVQISNIISNKGNVERQLRNIWTEFIATNMPENRLKRLKTLFMSLLKPQKHTKSFFNCFRKSSGSQSLT